METHYILGVMLLEKKKSITCKKKKNFYKKYGSQI